MRQSIKTLAVIFSVALNLAFLAGYGVRKLSNRPKFAYEELDLSKEQGKKIEDARDRFLSALDETGDRIISRNVELIDLIAADSVDHRAIETKFEEIHSLQQSIQQHVVQHLLQDKQILTPAQRTKFFGVLKSRIREQGAQGPPWFPAGALRKK
jgi:Spy/CpxP family protein refolding chaperone